MMPEYFHLPDLPTAGYATRREKELTDAIMLFMREIERDRIRLLSIVLDGPNRWRTVAGNIWRGLQVDTDALDEIYKYFTIQAAPPKTQRALLQAVQNPAKWRDVVKGLLPDLEIERERLILLRKWAP